MNHSNCMTVECQSLLHGWGLFDHWEVWERKKNAWTEWKVKVKKQKWKRKKNEYCPLKINRWELFCLKGLKAAIRVRSLLLLAERKWWMSYCNANGTRFICQAKDRIWVSGSRIPRINSAKWPLSMKRWLNTHQKEKKNRNQISKFLL